MKPHPLKVERELRGWSQARVAEAVGTNVRTVSRWEQRQSVPYPYYRELLCELFAKDARELGLLEETDEGSPQGTRSPTHPLGLPLLDPTMSVTPGGSDRLVGREHLLSQVKQRLWEGGNFALAALYGLPGMGKTSLAVALATDSALRERFRDGILWAGLGQEADVVSHLARWGTLLGITSADGKEVNDLASWMRVIQAAIGQRRLLLVIDDAWRIEDALALQVGGAHCAHLLTTRLPHIAFAFAREGTFPVAELKEDDGLLLLAQFVPQLIERDPGHALELVHAVGGSPLALTLMGHYVATQAFTGQARRVQAALARLRDAKERLVVSLPQPSEERFPSLPAGVPLSLHTAIALSEQRLSERARRVLNALALFPPKPNSFSEEAALAVSAASVETLDELWDAGLLESSGSARYTLHQTIADYARAQQAAVAAQQRFVTYIGWYLHTYEHSYEALDLEQHNILAALDVAFEQGKWPALIKGVHAFAPVLITRGGYPLAETHLQRSLEAARVSGDTLGQATARLHLGKIEERRGQYAQAHAYWQHGLLLARENEHSHCVAQLLRELGNLAWEQGQVPQAHQWLTEALDLLRHLEDQRGVAETLKSLGNLAREQGQPEQSNVLYEEALATFRRLGDQRGIAFTQSNLGIRAREEGRPEQARQLYEEALALLRGLGDQWSAAVVLSNLGNLARHQGEPEQARQFLEEALALSRQLESRSGLVISLVNLGGLASDQGEFEQARQFLNEALALARDLQKKRESALALQELGVVAWKQGECEQAHQFLDEALALFHDLEDQRLEALTLRDLGNLARQQGQAEQARQLYTQALTSLARLGDEREAAVTRQELGRLARQQGRPEEAESLLMEALSASRHTKDRQNVAWTLRELGLLQLQQGQWEQALRVLLGAGVGLALMNSPETSLVEEQLEHLRAHMDEETFLATVSRTTAETPEPAYGLDQVAWSTAIHALLLLLEESIHQGRAMSPEEAFAGAEQQALPAAALAASVPPAKEGAPTYPDDLTAREVEVLRLLSQGWSDAQIAQHLDISPRTVNRHTTSIYSKIGVSSRSAATRYALEQHLA